MDSFIFICVTSPHNEDSVDGLNGRRCIASDTVYTVVFGLSCIILGLIVSAILRLIDAKINRKLNRAQGVQEEEEAAILRTYVDEQLEQITADFEKASSAGMFSGKLAEHVENPWLGTPLVSKRGSITSLGSRRDSVVSATVLIKRVKATPPDSRVESRADTPIPSRSSSIKNVDAAARMRKISGVSKSSEKSFYINAIIPEVIVADEGNEDGKKTREGKGEHNAAFLP
ncbi:uncharacterized protein LOC111711827 isoform X1 [Eurytemora carolleeae]|uniref:uncharacterized protein LOC111711827 isoform X1 n=1 Tax=Eurytemora carolleeae TaxID=1294199 RepID=UPI000C78C1A8|nr:uncharacterized protein LOC111711827 isoform X1 [Eurytemora carolleeae]|eukprot:XP_023342046.1 uncharacterized protein LOC111711827 isoform X1 [Eurytemora affinis]